jgi:curli biogenesis system outer membrane secretion channel CsgG
MSIRSVLRGARLSAVTLATFTLGASARAQQPVVPEPGASDARPTVAVLYFTNAALISNADYAPLSKGMAEMLITELAKNPGVRVVERDRLQQLLAEQNLASGDRVDKETAVRLGKILGAHHLLMGSFVIDPKQNMRIDVRSVNTETSQVEYVESIDGKADRMLGMVSDLGAKVNNGLKLPTIPIRVQKVGDAGSSRPTSKVDQLRAVMMMSKALEQQDRGDVQGAIALYKQAIDADPSFERPKQLLASLESGPKRQTP